MAKEVNIGEKLVYTVAETAALLGLSLQGTYNAIWAGQIPSIKIRRTRLVPRAKLHALINGEA
jgi:excisionase family DNA binding protein